MTQEMKGFWDDNGVSWTIYKQSAPCSRQVTTPTPHHPTFTGRMLFLTPNRQRQSTEGTKTVLSNYFESIFNFGNSPHGRETEFFLESTTSSEMPISVALPTSHHFHPSLKTVASLSLGILHKWMRTSSRELRRPPGQPRTTRMRNIHDDLSSLDLMVHDARDLAQNRPLWRLISLHSATHS